MKDPLRHPMPPEVDVLYAAGIACDMPDGSKDGQLLCISNSIRFCYSVLNIYDTYVLDTTSGATRPRAEIRRLPTEVVERIRLEGHAQYIYIDPQSPTEHECVGQLKKPKVVANIIRARPRLRAVA